MARRMQLAFWRALSVTLTLLLAISAPLQHVALAEAAGQGGAYLADVRVGYGKNEEEAAKSLTDAGYQIMGYGGGKDGYADLNQGADSALTKKKVVYLGYKTTNKREEAITDLAVMGMGGGYSFSDYGMLMNKYRDQTVAPLQELVMRMVAEYRANFASADPGAKAKAELARAMLNRIVDDDTGGGLGDLLLAQTSQEMGATPSTMPEAEAAAWRKANPGVLDLECALMQGNADVIANMERLLAAATDDTGTTWLERLSDLGPDGLDARFADLRPADARAQADSLYQDAARLAANGWEELRADLVACDARYGAENVGVVESDDGSGGAGSENDAGVIELDGEGDLDVIGNNANAEEELVVEGDANQAIEIGDDAESLADSEVLDVDESVPVEVEELAQLDLPESEAREYGAEDAPELLGNMAQGLEAAGEVVEATDELRGASVYHFLKSLPWGDGTLYDYFVVPTPEACADGASHLYPLVSVLTEGQVASLEFQPLSSLVQAGTSTDEAFEALDAEHSNLVDVADIVPQTSVYQGVNRDIFGDLTALTSEAMRKNVLNSQGAGEEDFLSRHKTAVGLAAGAVVFGMVSGIGALMQSRARGIAETISQAQISLWDLVGSESNIKTFKIERVKNAPAASRLKVTVETLSPGTGPKIGYFSESSGLSESMTSFTDATQKLSQKEREYYRWSGSSANGIGTWGVVKKAFAVAMAVLALASIAVTAYELYEYYNVDYTPIPKYVVDEVDVTQTDSEGNQVVVRNDAAYYEVALTNRPQKAKHREALRDFADLNGDGGRGWLALYSCKDEEAAAPILADSLCVVVGSASLPDGYETGIHHFGEGAAANLTDMRYTYADDAGGIYTYFQRDEAAGATTAGSVFANGAYVLVGGVCLAAGVAVGAGVKVRKGAKPLFS